MSHLILIFIAGLVAGGGLCLAYIRFLRAAIRCYEYCIYHRIDASMNKSH